MSGKVRLYGETSGYVELSPPSVAGNTVLELPTDSIKPGLVHLHTETFSSVSSVSVDDVFSAEYDSYEVVVSSLYPSATGNTLTLRMRSSGSDDTASNYWYATEYVKTNNVTSRASAAPGASLLVSVTSAAAAGYISTYIRFIGPHLNDATRVNIESFGYIDGSNTAMNTSGSVLTSTQYDGFKLVMNSGTISGSLRIYGYRNN